VSHLPAFAKRPQSARGGRSGYPPQADILRRVSPAAESGGAVRLRRAGLHYLLRIKMRVLELFRENEKR